jgi:hypothetical protein
MQARVPDDMPSGVYEVVVRSSAGESASVELVVQPALPILPLLAIVGALAVVAVVAIGTRRRQPSNGRPAAT